MSAAETGRWWDNTAMVEKSDKFDSLVVIFSEDLDPSSVSASDFTVEGVEPTAAQMFALADQKRVYLTLAIDLSADSVPVVAINVAGGGAIRDFAGNTLSIGQVTATDEIGPLPTPTPVPGVSGLGLAIMAGLLAVAFIWTHTRRSRQISP